MMPIQGTVLMKNSSFSLLDSKHHT